MPAVLEQTRVANRERVGHKMEGMMEGWLSQGGGTGSGAVADAQCREEAGGTGRTQGWLTALGSFS